MTNAIMEHIIASVMIIATIHMENIIVPVMMDTDYKDYIHAWVCYQYFDFSSQNVIPFFAFFVIDIDECLENIAGCSDTCHNTIGSFYCTCIDGYELEFENGTKCLGQLARNCTCFKINNYQFY